MHSLIALTFPVLSLEGVSFAHVAKAQPVDFQRTSARVTFRADEEWIEGIGPMFGLTITIGGEINKDAAILVRKHYDALAELHRRRELDYPATKRSGKASVNILLQSMGGDVDAALEIGRLLREREANAIVPEGSKCASACVLVLAGATTRSVSGEVGIHRPYFETPSREITSEDIRRVSNLRHEQISAFFREMNISPRLADDMMMIRSDQIKWLSKGEVEIYGIGADDPVILETKILTRARKFGLTRAEYEVRWPIAREACTLGSADDCVEKIMRKKP
jgi:ATP-dependent protease ClpP protease subunit